MFWNTDELVLGRSGPLPLFPNIRLSHHARTGHMYVVGKTGKGKSKFLQSCLFQDIAAGRGCGVIDPHSDLVADLLWALSVRGILDYPAQRERIVYVNPADHRYIIPFNVLQTPGAPYEVAQNVIEAFCRTWPESLREAPHFSNVMLHALLLLIRSQQTLVDLPRLLLNKPFREEILTAVGDASLTAFFHGRYDAWERRSPEMRESTLNKVTALTLNPHLKLMLGQGENRLDFRQMMDEGKVLLVDLGGCDETSQKLIGSLITTGIEQAAFTRGENRRSFHCYIDEFQDFSASSGSTKTLSKILSGARKFGLYMTLAHQNLSQLSERMQGAISNTWTKVLFGLSEDDALSFARFVGLGNMDPSEIKHEAQTETQHPVFAPLTEQQYMWATVLANQKPRQALVRDHLGKVKQIWTLPMPSSRGENEHIRELKLSALKRYGYPLDEARQCMREGREVQQRPTLAPSFEVVR